ncbi:MAG: hypothetical protein AMXMBFR25_03250 [Lysobacterales bacterium]
MLVGAGLAPGAVAQNFTMRLEYAVTYTPFHPNGQVDTTPPYQLCRNNQIGLVFRYVWRNAWQEYIYTEPGGDLFPWYYMQGVTPNPVFVPAASGGGAVNKIVSVGLIAGSVNTGGIRQVPVRGRTSGFFGNPVQYATASVLVETQIEPPSTAYREIENGALDMPTRPWFSWLSSVQVQDWRMDIGACSNLLADTPEECTATSFPVMPLDDVCNPDLSDYCWIGTENFHRPVTALAADTPFQYHVLGRNNCGVADELGSDPPRPFFRTAQACFVVANGTIPDGGTVNFDATTLANIGALVPNLRVTVHTDHRDVSDLRISLTKTAPDAAGPLLLMDRPSGSNCADGDRVQAAFADGGAPLTACNNYEPAINGRVQPVQALSSFAGVLGAGNWRLSVQDTEFDGRSGSLLEWCLSSDVPIMADPNSTNPMIMANGYE